MEPSDVGNFGKKRTGVERQDKRQAILVFMLILVMVSLVSLGYILKNWEPEGLHYHEFRTNHEVGDMIQDGFKTGVIVGFTVTDTGQVFYQYQSYINDDMDTVIFTCPMEEATTAD